MRKNRGFGQGPLPAIEPFRVHVAALKGGPKAFRLCDWCLKNRHRCIDSHRYWARVRTWKAYRAKQYRIHE